MLAGFVSVYGPKDPKGTVLSGPWSAWDAPSKTEGGLFRFGLTNRNEKDRPSISSLRFALLVILGIVVDPTTAGVGDSKRAMSYEEPWEDQ